MNTLATRILSAILAAGLLAGAIYLGEQGFQRVLDFRTLERIPLSQVAESVGGEVNLLGRAEPAASTLTAPRTGETTLYYRYTIEREERDDDGNKSWRKIHDESRAVDFYLADNSGKALVQSAGAWPLIDWSVHRKFQRVSGDRRYTEWRVDPFDQVTLFGWLDFAPEPTVRFPSQGHYLPIISSFSATSERADLGMAAILFLWGGVSLLVLACLVLAYVFQIHRTLLFLLLVTMTTLLMLVHYGMRSLETDIALGFERVETHLARAEQLIEQSFSQAGHQFPGWNVAFEVQDVAPTLDPATTRKIDAFRRGSWIVRERYLKQIDRFPENVFAAIMGAGSPTPIALPASQLQAALDDLGTFESTRVSTQVFMTLGALLATLGLAYFAFRLIRVKRMQENLAISRTEGVVFGLTEVEGMLKPDDAEKMLEGPVSGIPCVWFQYIIKEQRGSGKNARTVTIADYVKKQAFWCQDAEGRIRIFPGHAEVITKHKDSKSEGKRTYTEYALRPDDSLYILGKARLDKTVGDSLVLGHEKDSPFIIANIPEREVMFRKAFSGFALLSVAISLLFLAVLWINGSSGQFSSLDFVLAGLAAPVFLALVVVVLMYNDLVFLRERCKRNWANIQVSLKKRSTLVSKLAEVARTFLEHEAGLQEDLAKLRTEGHDFSSPEEVDEYLAREHATINKLSLWIEAYPDLKGSGMMSDLTRRLIRLENEVALIRAGFNDSVMQYRTRLETFPDNLLAKATRFKPLSPLSFTEPAHQQPRGHQSAMDSPTRL